MRTRHRLSKISRKKCTTTLPSPVFDPQVRTRKVESSANRIEDSPSRFRGLEISGFQAAAFVFLFAVIGLTVGLTVGRGPLARPLRDAQKSILAVDATSPALPNRPRRNDFANFHSAGGKYLQYACSKSASTGNGRIALRKSIRSIPQCTTRRFSYPRETDRTIFSSNEPIQH